MVDLKSLKIKAEKDIQQVQNLKELQLISKKYLGKKGQVSLILREIKKLSENKRKIQGKQANDLKSFLKEKIKEKSEKMQSISMPFDVADWIDITVPGKKSITGHLHPLTLVKREIVSIFEQMGFSAIQGPEIETQWYNFDALNIPKDHPARDAWDTLWLKTNPEKLLLRTHTSPVQVRYMEKNNPPIRIIVPGKAFRYESTDNSHEFQFHQVEGLMVDKNISVSNLKAIIKEFFESFFKKQLDIKLRPDYFPFTEPSFEIAMTCLVCNGKGCSVCKKTGWLEMAGAGMVHPNVFKACKLDPKKWQGWAFGFGIDRLTMMKYKIPDIRLFNSGDLRFLQQF
ncbi:MAG: phenylalanine--tRNA ligase subunit alpha [Candidatus Pacebacteria bacterium]|nr:phenylalanine--tRNA ligase subunit alpha [Candidatus Paceibacterota bacterium]